MAADEPTPSHWDARYHGCRSPGAPARVLQLYQHLLPGGGTALDLACGLGANALLLAAHGLETWAWDFSPQAIAGLERFAQDQGLTIHTQVRDVLQDPPPVGQFDVITVSRFLDRALAPALMAALRPGGLLYYETFVADKVSSTGPSNPAFLLAENELLAMFSDMKLRSYHEEGCIGDTTQGIRDIAMLVAERS